MLSRASAVYLLALGRPPLFSPAGCIMLLLRPVIFSTHITKNARLTRTRTAAHTHWGTSAARDLNEINISAALPPCFYYLIGCFV